MEYGTWGIVFLNNGNMTTTVTLKLPDIGLTYGMGYHCTDIFNNIILGHLNTFTSYDFKVPAGPGGVLMLNCFDSS